MTAFGSNAVLSVFVLFCRIGACLMLMPGISGPRIPVKVRLFLAFAVTLGLAPLLSSEIGPELSDAPPFALMKTDRLREPDRRPDRLSRPHFFRRSRNAGECDRHGDRPFQSARAAERRRTIAGHRIADLARRDDSVLSDRPAIRGSARTCRLLRCVARIRTRSMRSSASFRSPIVWRARSTSLFGSAVHLSSMR